MEAFERYRERYYARGKHYEQQVIAEIMAQVNVPVTEIADEFLCLFYDMLVDAKRSQFPREVFEVTYQGLQGLYQKQSNLGMTAVMMDYLVESCSAYYRVPEYMSTASFKYDSRFGHSQSDGRILRLRRMTEICLERQLRLLLDFIRQTLPEYWPIGGASLEELTHILSEHGFDELIQLLNLDFQIAIDKDQFWLRKRGYETHYRKGKPKSPTMIVFFDGYASLMEETYHNTTAVLFAVTLFLNNYIMKKTSSFYISPLASPKLLFLKLSFPNLRCIHIQSGYIFDPYVPARKIKDLKVFDFYKHLRVDMDVLDLDPKTTLQVTIELAVMLYYLYGAHSFYEIYFYQGYKNSYKVGATEVFKEHFTLQEIRDILRCEKEAIDQLLLINKLRGFQYPATDLFILCEPPVAPVIPPPIYSFPKINQLNPAFSTDIPS